MELYSPEFVFMCMKKLLLLAFLGIAACRSTPTDSIQPAQPLSAGIVGTWYCANINQTLTIALDSSVTIAPGNESCKLTPIGNTLGMIWIYSGDSYIFGAYPPSGDTMSASEVVTRGINGSQQTTYNCIFIRQ